MLPNGLQVLMCYQSDAPTTNVSMAVQAGHFFDPAECHGLAHLLEHMLFLGSRHVPKPNGINELVEQNGGTINAWTGTEYANYHFNIGHPALGLILPAFADMLRAPLLNPNSMAKEIQAIEAEFQFKRKDDLRRLYQIHKETCNPAHPFSQFSVGNADIFNQLGMETLHRYLSEFHDRYYNAQNMRLCIHSAMPIAQLTELVKHAFGKMKSGSQPQMQWPALYTPEQLGVKIAIKPLQKARRMIVTFALPALHKEIHTRPLDYISHVLGDEGQGSLFAYLKAQNWVTSLIAGSGIEGEDFKDFNVNFQLTELGLNNQQHIICALFYALKITQDSFADDWRYNEKAQLSALAYQYDEHPKTLDMICDFAQSLFTMPIQDIEQWRAGIGSYDKTLLEAALGHFTPHNMRIKIIAPTVTTDKTCSYYDAEYAVNPIPAEELESYYRPTTIPSICMPPANPFIGDDFALCLPDNDFATPKQLVASDNMSIWFSQDTKFRIPKGDTYVSFDTNAFCESQTTVAAKRIWLAALNDKLKADFYHAEIAGLNYRIYGHQAGFTVHCRGFTNQQFFLCRELLKSTLAFIPSREEFEQVKQLQMQSLHNSLLNKPTNRLFLRLSVLIQKNTHAPIDLLEAMHALTYDELVDICNKALQHYYVESLIHGNWPANEAKAFVSDLKYLCQNNLGTPISRDVAQLPVGNTHYHFVPCEHDDSGIVLYLQAPSCDLHDTAMCMILEQMLAGPFFNALRTQKQLGYIVGTGYVPHNQHPGIVFYIQSPNTPVDQLLENITQFLFEQLDEIAFYQGYWPDIQSTMLKQLSEHDLSLSMKSQRLWLALGMQDFSFDRNTCLAKQIESYAFDDIEAYARQLATRQSFGELVLFTDGKLANFDAPQEFHLSDISAFKQTANYFK